MTSRGFGQAAPNRFWRDRRRFHILGARPGSSFGRASKGIARAGASFFDFGLRPRGRLAPRRERSGRDSRA